MPGIDEHIRRCELHPGAINPKITSLIIVKFNEPHSFSAKNEIVDQFLYVVRYLVV